MDELLKLFRSQEGDDQLELFDPPKKHIPKRFHSFPILVVLVLALGLWAVSKAKSDEQQFRAQGVFCDTKEDVTDFVTDWNGHNAQEVVKAVNERAGSMSCIISEVTLEEVARTTLLTAGTGTWQLVEIKIHALHGGGMTIYLPTPKTNFTYIQVSKGQDA